MTDLLPAIATKLAAALRCLPCKCVTREHWPWKEARTCSRCAALAEYDAFVSIVQVPKVKP